MLFLVVNRYTTIYRREGNYINYGGGKTRRKASWLCSAKHQP